ncbi:ribosome biogenesis atpase rix7 [Brachionus plicatilis]|uniref:Ribosome biogenesis atpase rix7 n=1 Tax=Brachionus plicatilis TaxID=10195 RepID=A0A3M7S502_BRAPC|nr:ribosome biogenesis atpase rix7 [Brachionus plicatilis]
MFSNSGPLTDMKFTPDSLAIALASSVLPQPGGPTIKMPGGLKMFPKKKMISTYKNFRFTFSFLEPLLWRSQ